jgi:bifunctional UDP-N-acetylglucosamine pyrophosphorylase/glucosamine-1-phosphate N-acetyltransferase
MAEPGRAEEDSMVVDAVILAAGLGTRMVSKTPKALHQVGGVPLVAWAERACRQATGRPPIVVIGPEGGGVREVLPEDVRFVEQQTRQGTGHALQQAEAWLRDGGQQVLVATTDMPLVRPETLRRLVQAQKGSSAPVALVTLTAEDPRGFGRVIRDATGGVRAIVEESVATAEQRETRELNASLYCFDREWLGSHLSRLAPSAKGEIYLTDLVELASGEGRGVPSIEADDPDELIGINTREHLAQAEEALRRRINREWMLAGVTLADPASTYIEASVRLEPDVLILPNTHLKGTTSVGSGSIIGPNTIVRDSTIGPACTVEASVVEAAELEAEVHVGPFAHLRPGARLGRGVHMGNFGEVKNSVLGPGVKMGHFSYVGDAEIGRETNIGAGTITCNFDRQGRKNRTSVGEAAFIGSDTLLVAPVRVGDGAATGAGSVVTREVPSRSLAVGMPARVVRKLKDDE